MLVHKLNMPLSLLPKWLYIECPFHLLSHQLNCTLGAGRDSSTTSPGGRPSPHSFHFTSNTLPPSLFPVPLSPFTSCLSLPLARTFSLPPPPSLLYNPSPPSSLLPALFFPQPCLLIALYPSICLRPSFLRRLRPYATLPIRNKAHTQHRLRLPTVNPPTWLSAIIQRHPVGDFLQSGKFEICFQSYSSLDLLDDDFIPGSCVPGLLRAGYFSSITPLLINPFLSHPHGACSELKFVVNRVLLGSSRRSMLRPSELFMLERRPLRPIVRFTSTSRGLEVGSILSASVTVII
ncbi:uncharacterized protein AKAW2_10623S [Aspergillus luchuensis]|uniref:Uncharacterized protein n=1 Tax=Aspergillus kawachii TaxID=1069201 RepID=A0A7R7VZE6_ASPKA|nr:uncharacterized protein AKAW2_10623S [Aspergillus luchuensis]BCR93577.1 hypothetical protein AKAW2_10623S [Aspergillus luchuensis]